MTNIDRPLSNEGKIHQLYSLSNAVCVAGTARAAGKELTIITPSQHGAFAVHVPLIRPLEQGATRGYGVRLRILVRQGAVGVGVLNNDHTEFYQELLIGATKAWHQVEVTTPAIDAAGPLIFRNGSREGSSIAECAIAGTFPIGEDSSGIADRNVTANMVASDDSAPTGNSERLERQESESILFLHIPKTGGTTVWNTLSAATRVSVNINTPRALRQFFELPEMTIRQCQFIFGHMPYGLHLLLRQECKYVVFLRDPVDRVVSAYYYTKRTPSHPLYERTRSGMTLVQFVRSVERDNTQTRQLGHDDIFRAINPASDGWQRSAGPLTNEDLECAKEHLRSLYFIGFREDLAKDLCELHRRLGLPVPTAIPRYLEANNRPRIDDIDPEAARVICECNAFDIELYKYARGLRGR
jgi:hypothetical protein